MLMKHPPFTTVRSIRPLTEIEFAAWVAQAVPGERFWRTFSSSMARRQSSAETSSISRPATMRLSGSLREPPAMSALNFDLLILLFIGWAV